MNQLISDFNNHSISNNEIDDLCKKMSDAQVEFNERQELYNFLDMKKAGIKVLKITDERYLRYIKGIDNWEIDGVSYEYIRENIKMYLDLQTNKENLISKLKLMRTIDKQLRDVIENN